MKKILFLIMVYDNPIIMEEYHTILKHYLEIKEKNHLDNIEFYGFTSGPEDSYDDENRLFSFKIGIPESNFATYIKTQKVFEYADNHFDFDYVYRTNTSTFCNIVLLNEFVQNTDLPDNLICGAEMYCKNTIENNTVKIDYKYIRGNSVLLPRVLLKPIYEFDNALIDKAREKIILTADDDIIGFILQNKEIVRKTYFQEWVNCLKIKHHIFSNDDISPKHLYNFIALQYKSYINRNEEIKTLNYLCDIFKKYKYKKQHLWNVYKYYNGRNVIFIHPQVGYVGELGNTAFKGIGNYKKEIIDFIKNKEE